MAAGFLSMDGINGMRGWQWLFLIEGLLCVLVSLYWVFVMPRSIETMKVRRGLCDVTADETGLAQCAPVLRQIPHT
jgi:type II secretory pathway component PulM